jgi:hypothetical protein
LPASSTPQLPSNWVGARSHTGTIRRNSAILCLAALLHSVFCEMNVPKYLNLPILKTITSYIELHKKERAGIMFLQD